jgi:glycosyltransferase involved in cell wall biosynthesis
MNILILNWRDIKNPTGGGAEIATHELAKQWVSAGFSVTQFSSEFEGAKLDEVIDGIKIVRRGRPDVRQSLNIFNTVHFRAFMYCMKNREKLDLIIDEIHGLPFFTPLYARGKTVALICEIAKDIWIKEFGRFFGSIGRLVEKMSLKLLYNNLPIMTISASTKEDLVEEGVPAGNILVLNLGINVPKNLSTFKKEKGLTLIFLGRLSRTKGIEDAINAFSSVKSKIGSAKFWIVGTGPKSYQKFLKNLTRKFRLEKSITFFGFVSEIRKFKLLARSHMLVFPSMREGWGLTVVEAGRVFTPSVAYNSQGLKDSIINGKTGILCKLNTPDVIKDEILSLYSNRKLYEKMKEEAYNWSAQFTWEKAGVESINYLNKAYKNNKKYEKR